MGFILAFDHLGTLAVQSEPSGLGSTAERSITGFSVYQHSLVIYRHLGPAIDI
jgi:hypothetical protein